MHGLLDDERAAVVDLFEAWAGIDRSHRKLAARGSRLDLVHVSASTMHRVLHAEGLVLPGPPAREPAIRAPWPDWIVWKPGRVWCYDFTHFTRARRAAVAVLDVVSRRWLATLVSAEETSTQIEAAFIAALEEEQLADRIDARLLAALHDRRESDRAGTHDGHHITGLDPAVLRADLQAGREDVGQEQDLRVADAVGHLVHAGLSEWNPDVLSLGPVDEMPEDPPHPTDRLAVAGHRRLQ